MSERPPEEENTKLNQLCAFSRREDAILKDTQDLEDVSLKRIVQQAIIALLALLLLGLLEGFKLYVAGKIIYLIECMWLVYGVYLIFQAVSLIKKYCSLINKKNSS